jgi:hypothetical protein
MAILVVSGDTSGSVSLSAPSVAGSTTITLPAVSGNLLSSTAVSASTTATVTNKVAINIGGTVYYLLASTSGV